MGLTYTSSLLANKENLDCSEVGLEKPLILKFQDFWNVTPCRPWTLCPETWALQLYEILITIYVKPDLISQEICCSRTPLSAPEILSYDVSISLQCCFVT